MGPIEEIVTKEKKKDAFFDGPRGEKRAGSQREARRGGGGKRPATAWAW